MNDERGSGDQQKKRKKAADGGTYALPCQHESPPIPQIPVMFFCDYTQ